LIASDTRQENSLQSQNVRSTLDLQQRFKQRSWSLYWGETTRAIMCALSRYNAFLRETHRRSIAIYDSFRMDL